MRAKKPNKRGERGEKQNMTTVRCNSFKHCHVSSVGAWEEELPNKDRFRNAKPQNRQQDAGGMATALIFSPATLEATRFLSSVKCLLSSSHTVGME